MKLIVEIFNKYPSATVCAVVCKGIDNSTPTPEIAAMQKAVIEQTRKNFSTETLSQDVRIKAWREAYSSFGAKPKKYKSSVEALLRRVLTSELPNINKLVDLYNVLSMKHVLPIGGDDLDKVEGNIHLTFANGNERFFEINSTQEKHPKQGEVIYCDDNDVLCRRWNWRECEKTKLTPETKNAVLYVEGFDAERVTTAAQDLAALVQRFCNGSVQVFTLTKDSCEALIYS